MSSRSLALLLLLPLGVAAFPFPQAEVAHEAAPRRSAESFEVELRGASMWDVRAEANGPSCVQVSAQGAAAVAGGRAVVSSAGSRAPPRLVLSANAPRGTPYELAGALPLAMEVRGFSLHAADEAAVFGIHVAKGAPSVALGERVRLWIELEHVGAPLQMALVECAPDDPSLTPSSGSRGSSG